MSIIITATDFSDISTKAVNYACSLAQDQDAAVIVFHSFIIPVTFSDTPMPVMPIDEGQKIAEERMGLLTGQLKESYPTLNITSKIIYGDILDSLEDYLENGAKPWLIVLGNDGDTFLSGSTSLAALRDLDYPVLAIPGDVAYRPVKKICFAIDYKSPFDRYPILQLADLVKKMNASLHVINIDHSPVDAGTSTSNVTELQEIIAALQPSYYNIDNEDTDEAIQDFVTANHMDWLVIIPHRHSFLGNLFRKSHTAAMVRMSHIPLVALHEHKKEG